MQDLTGKITGNTYTAAEFVEFQTELKKLITNSGITPSGGDLNQVAKALSTQIPSASFLTATGTKTITVLTSVGSHQPIDSYVDGSEFRFRPVGDNNTTGTLTINIDTLGAKSVLRPDGTALRVNDILGSVDARVRYDTSSGGRFLLLNRQNKKFEKGHLIGGHLSYFATAGVSASAFEFRNDANTADGVQLINFDKNFGSVFALGSGIGTGGFPSGATRAVASPFGVFGLVNQDGVIDMGFDSDLTGANLVAAAEALSATGWSARLIQILMSEEGTDTNLEPFIHTEEDLSYIRYKRPVHFISGAIGAAATATIAAPAQCPANCAVSLLATSTTFGLINSVDESDYTIDNVNHHFSGGGSAYQTTQVTVIGDDSRQIRYKSDAAATLRALVIGYYFNRGSE